MSDYDKIADYFGADIATYSEINTSYTGDKTRPGKYTTGGINNRTSSNFPAALGKQTGKNTYFRAWVNGSGTTTFFNSVSTIVTRVLSSSY